MKILIILIRWKGGVGRLCLSIKKELEKKGHKVDVISREEDLKCYSLKDSFLKLREEVKKRDYDILYTQDWSSALPLLFYKNHYCCFCGRETTKSRPLQLLIGKIMGENLVVIDDKLKEEFPKATLVYCGVDRDIFRNLKLRRILNSVGFVNFHDDSYNYEEIRKAVEELGMIFMESNLKLSQKKLEELYNKIETFISLPKEFAGFNQSWLEAMSCKVPKIIGNYNGVGKSLNMNHIEKFKSIKDALKNSRKTDYELNPKFDWNVHTNKILEIFKK